MKKLYLIINVYALIVVITGIVMILNVKNDYTQIEIKTEPIKPIVEIESVEYPIPTHDDVIVATPTPTVVVTKTVESDLELMAKVVHAEAGNQDELGKRLIADVILNRVDSSTFPNTIRSVCTQDYQFAIHNSYAEDDMNAVLAEISSRTDYDVVWFRTDHYHSFGEEAFQHGDHYFSKEEK